MNLWFMRDYGSMITKPFPGYYYKNKFYKDRQNEEKIYIQKIVNTLLWASCLNNCQKLFFVQDQKNEYHNLACS